MTSQSFGFVCLKCSGSNRDQMFYSRRLLLPILVLFCIMSASCCPAFYIGHQHQSLVLRDKFVPNSLHVTWVVRDNEADDTYSQTLIDFDGRRRRQLISMMLASITTTLTPDHPSNALTIVDSTDIVSEFSGILKPPLDECEYVTYTLENGLRVLLCSDPSPSYQAAAAMDVHVGACSDPDFLPGLAHFLEHMIFLGTNKYPKEDSFGEFLSVNGGSSNAYTDSENTVYFFSMNAEADNKLLEGLSRFGSFFSGPLFTETATGRELNAIESENAKNLQSDIFREFQINKSRANTAHPFSKFFTGNKKTLLEGTKAMGIDLRSELIKFYNQYYSANQMTLAVVAPQSIEVLKRMIKECFLDIPNKFILKPEERWIGIPPFLNENSKIPSFQHIVEIVPVSDLRQVQIAWPIIYRSELDRSASQLIKPSQYIAHLLGHEGPRSLLSFLKRMGWANTLGSSTNEILSDFETFEIVVGLTSKGFAALDNVVEAIYSYIGLLRYQTIPDYVFKEVLQLAELQWRFLTKGGPGDYATSLSTAMQTYPPALYVAGPRRLALDEYTLDPQLSNLPRNSFPTAQQLQRTRDQVNYYATFLNVDNGIVTVLSKSFDGRTDKKELWYGTDYRAREIPLTILNKWRNCESSRDLKMDFPIPNQFIPSEAGLRVKYVPDGSEKLRKSFEERMISQEPPRIIRDDGIEGRWTVYFKEDKQFGKPKGFVIFEILTSELFSSPKNAALANLYEICVADKLREYAYDAELAGLSYDVKILARGIRLTFGGYNDKLKRFASFVSNKISGRVQDLLPTDDKDFDRYKDQIMRALSAFDVSQPYSHASYYAQLTLQPRRFQYTNKSLRDSTRKMTLPDLVTYAKSAWKSGKGVCLIQGNFNEVEALDFVRSAGDIIPFQPISVNDYPPKLEALPLPVSDTLTLPPRLLIAEPNPANENSACHVIIQSLDKSEKNHVLMELLNAVVDEPFYNELRTKQQLGYIVASGIKAVAETRTLSFIVQSSIAPSSALTLEVLKFLDNVEAKILQKISNADLAVYVKSLIEKKTDPDRDLSVEATRNWSEISSGRLQFDRLIREAAALLDVEKKDLIDFWRQIYVDNGRRVLITEVIPRQGAAASEAPSTSAGYGRSDFPKSSFILGIDDIDQFRKDREHQFDENGKVSFSSYTN